MAVNPGVRVIATTRSRERFAMPEKLGAARCEIERPDLSKHIPEAKRIDGPSRQQCCPRMNFQIREEGLSEPTPLCAGGTMSRRTLAK